MRGRSPGSTGVPAAGASSAAHRSGNPGTVLPVVAMSEMRTPRTPQPGDRIGHGEPMVGTRVEHDPVVTGSRTAGPG